MNQIQYVKEKSDTRKVYERHVFSQADDVFKPAGSVVFLGIAKIRSTLLTLEQNTSKMLLPSITFLNNLW